MAKPKNVDDVGMDFTDTIAAAKDPSSVIYNVTAENAPEVKKEAVEEKPKNVRTFQQDGEKVFEYDNDTRLYTFYDGDGNQLDDDIVEKLREAYPPIPIVDDNGGERVGPTVIREVDDNNQTPKDANFSGKVTMITERQNFSSGQAFTKTILKKNYNVVRALRGEIGNQ